MSLQMRKTMVLASDELPSTTQNSTFLWDDILYKAAMKTQYAQDCELIVAFTRKICLRGTRIGWAAITNSIHSLSIASDHQLYCFLHFFWIFITPATVPPFHLFPMLILMLIYKLFVDPDMKFVKKRPTHQISSLDLKGSTKKRHF